MSEHPFLSPSLEIPWPELTPARLYPDLAEAIRRAEAALAELLAQPVDTLTYDNSFGAYDDLCRLVGDPWALVQNLESVDNTPAFRTEFKRAQPEVTRFFSSLPLNAALWAQLKAFAESPLAEALDPVRARHVEEVVAGFRLSGADLPKAQKDRLMAIAEELAKLCSQFGENYLDAMNAFELLVDDESRLAGLPESAREAARESAKEKGQGSDEAPVWRFTLQMPSFGPFMRYAEDADLRRQLWEGFSNLARTEPHANEPLIWQILALRDERAKLLGFAQFADLALNRRMARDGATALRFVEDLHDRIADRFLAECGELEAFRDEILGSENGRLEPWDLAYWHEKMRLAKCDFDEEALRPYFSVDRVIDGMFRLTEELFGFKVRERTGDDKPPVWHPEVRAYEIVDTATGRFCGLFYTDWHPRETKRSGAWMAPVSTGNGADVPGVALMAGNMTKPVGGKPALLLHGEVETIFHEFGHLLHQLLSEVPVRSLGGAETAWDFVELPSQIMENWCWERASLDRFAQHHATGELIPEPLFAALRRTRTFRTASFMMRQLSFGQTDLKLHLHYETIKGRDLDAWWAETNAAYLTPLATPARTNLRVFSHLFSDPVGYAAGYYSYMWADVLASDAFSRFLDEGVLNPETGRAFRDCVLAKGNSAPPEQLFRDFMGRDPDPEALLRVNGLA